MPIPLIGGALSDDAVWHLSVVYIGPKSRTERPRKTKIGTEVAHVTRTPPSRSKGQRWSHQAALLTAAFTHQAAAAVSMGKYSLWEPTATLPSAGAAVGVVARSALGPTEGGERRGHIVAAARVQLVYNLMTLTVDLYGDCDNSTLAKVFLFQFPYRYREWDCGLCRQVKTASLWSVWLHTVRKIYTCLIFAWLHEENLRNDKDWRQD